jgi:L-methionine (R)-S-oxide reductase
VKRSLVDELEPFVARADARAWGEVAELIRAAGGYRWVGLYLVTDTEIRAVAWTGPVAPAFPRFPREKGLNGVAVSTKAPVICQDVSKDSRYLTTFASTGSEAVFPVLSDTGHVVGTIDVERDRPNAFTPDDERLLAHCAARVRPLWKSAPREGREVRAQPVQAEVWRGPLEQISMITAAERETLQSLHDSVLRSLERAEIQETIQRVQECLRGDGDRRIAWETLPVELFGPVPAEMRSSWVFALRAGATTGAERHPNSHQRVMSICGSADLQIWNGTAWVSNRLSSRDDAGLLQRWLSIPPSIWHRPVVDPGEDWFVVSFHTAEADQLIEELATNNTNPDDAATHANVYAGRLAR